MNRDDIRKLLGGYATGTLTPEEQQALFEAAVSDQALFDELMREQPLRDLLRDPASKAQLLAALDERPVRWYQRWQAWSAAAVAMAAVTVVAVVVVRQNRPVMRVASVAAPVAEVAQVKAPEAAPVVPEQAAPVPEAKPLAAPGGKSAPPKHAVRQSTAPMAMSRRAAPAPAMEAVPAPRAAASLVPPPPAVAAGGAGGRGGRSGLPGAAAESVEVTAAANPVQPQAAADQSLQNARDLFYRGMPAAAGNGFLPRDSTVLAPPQQSAGEQEQQRNAEAQQSRPAATRRAAVAAGLAGAVSALLPNPGVRYTILRKSDTGEFVEVSPDNLKTGDTVELRFETNQTGFLTVVDVGSARAVVSTSMQARRPITTAPLLAGANQLQVTFSRGAPSPVTPVALDGGPSPDTPNQTQRQAAENATYVVGRQPFQPVRFTIRLNFK